MYKQMLWSSKRKQIKINPEPLKTIWTSWGQPYQLYREFDSNRYFADNDDGFGTIEQIDGKTEDEAIKNFEIYMQDLERDVMPKFHIIDLDHRDAREELKEYTLQELKKYFEPNADDLPRHHEKWEEVEDIDDLREYLDFEADGMRQHYKIEEA